MVAGLAVIADSGDQPMTFSAWALAMISAPCSKL